jgi:hypothetical protein
MIGFKLKCERLESREVPASATVGYVVNTALDLPDANLNDGQPLTATGMVSLRSVIEHYNANPVAVPGPNPPQPFQTCVVEFANVLGQQFQNEIGAMVTPTPLTEMTVLLSSQLPAIGVGRDYIIAGSTTRRVTITRDPTVNQNDMFRFLEVAAGGKVGVNGLQFTNAVNRGGGNMGGAILNTPNGILNVVNCRFYNNVAEEGGAIANYGFLTVAGWAPTGAKSEFEHNTAKAFGGAIVTGALGPPACTADIQDSAFWDNVAGDNPQREGKNKGGAVAFRFNGMLNVARCNFTDNKGSEGGALYADGPNHVNPSLTVTDSKFEHNLAEGLTGKGGAAFIDSLNSNFTRCEFKNNIAVGALSEGGGFYQSAGKLTLDTCVFLTNKSFGPNGSDDVANVAPQGIVTTVFPFNTAVQVVQL